VKSPKAKSTIKITSSDVIVYMKLHNRQKRGDKYYYNTSQLKLRNGEYNVIDSTTTEGAIRSLNNSPRHTVEVMEYDFDFDTAVAKYLLGN